MALVVCSYVPTSEQIKKRQPETPGTEWRKAEGDFYEKDSRENEQKDCSAGTGTY